MFNNCVSKLNLKMVLLIFIAGFGFSDYLRIFSNLFESKSLMCTNTFYALQRSYIIPTIKKIWNEHQKRIQQRIEQPLQVYVDGRWSRPQRKKGTAEYLSEVLIDAKTQFVLAIDTLSKNDKKEGMGNEEAQCLIQILTTSPIKELEIDEIISDENKSLIKRIKETNLPVEISLYHFLTTRQTSIVETFNSTLNLWCPKYKHFKKDVYEARTYMTALHWNYQLISCQNSKQFMINKQLSKQIQSQVLNSFEQYHPYFNKNKKDPLMIDRQDHNENWNENGDKKENF
ncbi:hypothetical protein M0812_11941 [Anaeramoeba flamelloides]|uniref:Transposase n=1 Tax=Anaeramoeba flamelloides TaxID=1746091 RepID=A0AAV7ZQD4_9EUKA|nr:hypothetical protein M0812_11941 [Anaeramoeba flamelloides]